MAALREIKHYQKSVGHLIPKIPFQRLVREVLEGITLDIGRFQGSALDALQDSAEAFLVTMFEGTCAMLVLVRY